MTLNSYFDIYVIEEQSKQVQHEYLVEIVDIIGRDKTDNKLDLHIQLTFQLLYIIQINVL